MLSCLDDHPPGEMIGSLVCYRLSRSILLQVRKYQVF